MQWRGKSETDPLKGNGFACGGHKHMHSPFHSWLILLKFCGLLVCSLSPLVAWGSIWINQVAQVSQVTTGELYSTAEQPSSRTSICPFVHEGTERTLENDLQAACVHVSDHTVRDKLYDCSVRAPTSSSMTCARSPALCSSIGICQSWKVDMKESGDRFDGGTVTDIFRTNVKQWE